MYEHKTKYIQTTLYVKIKKKILSQYISNTKSTIILSIEINPDLIQSRNFIKALNRTNIGQRRKDLVL